MVGMERGRSRVELPLERVRRGGRPALPGRSLRPRLRLEDQDQQHPRRSIIVVVKRSQLPTSKPLLLSRDPPSLRSPQSRQLQRLRSTLHAISLSLVLPQAPLRAPATTKPVLQVGRNLPPLLPQRNQRTPPPRHSHLEPPPSPSPPFHSTVATTPRPFSPSSPLPLALRTLSTPLIQHEVSPPPRLRPQLHSRIGNPSSHSSHPQPTHLHSSTPPPPSSLPSSLNESTPHPPF